MALCNPQSHLPWLIGLALPAAFASAATQDIAHLPSPTAWKIAEEQPPAASLACYMTLATAR